MVELQADAAGALRHRLAHGAEVVVALPVGVDQVVTQAAAIALAAVDVGGDQRRAVLGHHQRIAPAEGAVEEVAEVVDVVDRGQHHCVQLQRLHLDAQHGQATVHLRHAESGAHFRPVGQVDKAGHAHAGTPVRC
ncbi:hypothetical protein D3C78_1013130 [compost metagenome]